MNPNSVDILLVEDNAVDAELAIRELKRHNMTNNLYHVKNGKEAIDFIFATGQYAASRDILCHPKLVLLDIHMPKMDGIEVLSRIKSSEATRAMPVVILTSSKEHPDILRCYDLGANSYIVKPVNFDRFAEAIHQLGFYWLLLNEPPA